MRTHDVLVVGIQADSFAEAAKRHGYQLISLGNVDEALLRLKAGSTFDLTLVALTPGLASPLNFVQPLRVLSATGALAVVADSAQFASCAKDLMEGGVAEVVPGPLTEAAFEALLLRASRMHELAAENQYHRRNSVLSMEELIGRSEAWQQVRKTQDTLAASRESILIIGEAGTGRHAMARALHRRSSQSNGPLIQVNCAAWPDSLLDTELFGSDRGSRRTGSFDLARGGTLLLAEADRMASAVQDKLLQALKNQKPDCPSNVRVICLTSKTNFQSALTAILSPLTLPALRERSGDTILLAEYFLRQARDPYARTRVAFDLDAKEALINCSWPGNLRELKSVIERALVASSAALLTAADLGMGLKSVSTATPVAAMPTPVATPEDSRKVTFLVGQPLHEMEQEMLVRTLEMTNGNRTRAASILGISVRTLYSKLLEIEQQRKMAAAKNETPKELSHRSVANGSRHNLASV